MPRRAAPLPAPETGQPSFRAWPSTRAPFVHQPSSTCSEPTTRPTNFAKPQLRPIRFATPRRPRSPSFSLKTRPRRARAPPPARRAAPPLPRRARAFRPKLGVALRGVLANLPLLHSRDISVVRSTDRQNTSTRGNLEVQEGNLSVLCKAAHALRGRAPPSPARCRPRRSGRRATRPAPARSGGPPLPPHRWSAPTSDFCRQRDSN